MNITMELVMPVQELNPQMILDIFKLVGATPAGGYVVFDGQYGNGSKYMGPLVKIRNDLFTWSWDGVNNKLKVEPYIKDAKHAMVDDFEITVRGSTSGDTVMFKTEYDAKDWLKTLSSIEQLKLNVQTEDYTGSAIMYMANSTDKPIQSDNKNQHTPFLLRKISVREWGVSYLYIILRIQRYSLF